MGKEKTNNEQFIENNINVVHFKNSQKMKEIIDESIDLVVTSPPYFNIKDYSKDGNQEKTHSKSKSKDIGNQDNYDNYLKEMLKVWKECWRVLKPNGKLCINVPLMPMLKKEYSTHENRNIFDIQSDIQNSILKNTELHLMDLYIWNRTNSTKRLMFGSYPYPSNFYNQNIIEFITVFVKGGKSSKRSKEIKEKSKLTQWEWINYTKQIWDIPIPNKSDLAFGIHSAIMPEEIPYRLIKLFSFVGDVVLDPFSGSGTTLKIAKDLDRNYIGYELYDSYKEIISKKVENIIVKNNNEKYVNKLINKDINVGLNLIQNNSIDLIVADPPYNISISDWDIFETEEKYFIFMKNWLLKAISKLKNNGSIYLFNNSKNSAKLLVFLEEECGLNIQNSIIWYKKDGFAPSKRKYINNQETILFLTKGNDYIFNYEEIRVPYESKERIEAAAKNGILKNGKRWFPNENGKMCTDVWEFSSDRHQNKINGKTVKAIHPTVKPSAMIERIILASSNEGDVVLDLFSGSGTTSIAAKKLRRNFIAIENNKEYAEYINKRLYDE